MTPTAAITAVGVLVNLGRLEVRVAAKGDRISLRPASRVTPDLLETVRDHKHELLVVLAEPRRRWREQAVALLRMLSDPALHEDLLHLFDEREAIASVDGGLGDHHAGLLAYRTLLNHTRERH